jgi:hypothetical protein
MRILVAVLLLAPWAVDAAVLQSPAPFAGQTLVTFDEFTGPGAGALTVGNPVVAGGVVEVSTTNTAGSFLGTGFYGLGENGSWDSPRSFVGLELEQNFTDQGTLTFRFLTGPVSAAGLFLNYLRDPNFLTEDVILAALDSNGNVLESVNISRDFPIVTPNSVNAGAFRGIVRGSADIAALTISNSAVVGDDLAFGNVVIPEPSHFAPIAGMLVWAAARRARIRR